MIPKGLMQKLTKKEAGILAVACALKAGIHGGKNSVGSVVVHDKDRPWASLTLASGVTAIRRMERVSASIAGALAETRMCKYCGCSECDACPGGCSWIDAECCCDPRCVEKREAERTKRKPSRKGAKKRRAK